MYTTKKAHPEKHREICLFLNNTDNYKIPCCFIIAYSCYIAITLTIQIICAML